ncbi:Gfo/Idh/MocA family protein [Caenimonas soli]|uniref:Gfo/Idh/MocA family protein n=1 Tax=Caenimonas soli TaxID=2735555 RepID=UPI00155436CC|nr:Gfo/Idh/MocA family oxidoreductase [Caenimonas soli]NPC56217.1 Gfo/Idh/MocA family oxidoreductase [Caenimonas soli]
MAFRVLVTGRGSIAKRHTEHLRALSPGVVVAVISRTGTVDESFEPCEVFADMARGLRWKPDAVVIASVSSRHADELDACLQGGLPCLVEKPIVIARQQLVRLRASAAAAPAPLAVQVGCNLRHLPALARLRQILASGTLGRLVRAQLEVGQDLTQWRPGRGLAGSYSADSAQGGGVVFDLVHEIDMAVWLLGPLQVKAAIGGHLSSLPVSCDDVHTALLVGPGAAPVVVALDYVSQRPVRRYSFVAERGSIVCDLIAREITVADRAGVHSITSDATDFDVAGTYRSQMADWLAAVQYPQRPLVSPLSEAFEAAELMLAMKEAT